MATLEQLERALVNADAAGDVEAARALAAEISRQRSSTDKPVFAGGLADSAMDLVRSAGTGLRQGAEGIIGTIGDIREFSAGLGEAGARRLGASPETASTVGTLFRSATPLGPLGMAAPTTETIQGATSSVIGEHYRPRSVAGEYARTAGEFAPAVAAPGGAVRKAASVAVPAFASETAGQMTAGSEAEPYARAIAALLGGAAVAPGRRAALKAAADDAPSSRALTDQTNQAYANLRSKGIVYDADEFAAMTAAMGEELTRKGFRQASAPKTFALIDDVWQGMGRSPNFDDIDSAKRAFRATAQSAEGSERGASNLVLKMLDMFEQRAPSISTAGASGDEIQALTREARDLGLRNIKTRVLDDIVSDADTFASGRNLTIPRRLGVMLRSKQGKGLFRRGSADREAILEAKSGSPARKLLSTAGTMGIDLSRGASARQFLGPFLGGAAGYSIGIPLGEVVVPALGSAAKVAARKMTEKDIDMVRALIRGGAPLQQQARTAIDDQRLKTMLIEALLAKQAATPGP